MRRPRAARAPLWLVCLALQLVAVRHMWIDERVADGQMLRGVFEEPQGRPQLALTDCCGEEFFPGPGLDAHGAVAVSPGMIAVVNLKAGGTFVVKTDESTPTPYLVFGTKRGAADGSWFSDAQRFEADTRGLRLADWDGGESWHADARWLTALSEQCGAGDTRTVYVAADGDHADVRLGQCPPATVRTADGRPLLMAVVAGPSWLTVGREETGFRVERHVNTGILPPLLVVAAISIAGLAAIHPGAAVALSAGLAVLSAFAPYAAWLTYLAVPLLVVVGAVLRLSDRVIPFRRRWMRTCIGCMGVAIVLLAIVVTVQRAARNTFTERRWTEAGSDAGARCRLIGYSPVDNAQLRAGGGVSSMLAQCSACAGGLEVAARHGGRVDWMRRQVCAPEATPGVKAVVAIGGDNDDMLWAQGPADYFRHASAMLRFAGLAYARTVRPDYLPRTIDALAASAAHAVDDQAAALRAAAQCAGERGERFVFVHDLFIQDLAAGRSAVRRGLLERRRDAVAADGRERFFVDALEAFPEMGVSWFNDIRHPSLIGHRKIAERICDVLRQVNAPDVRRTTQLDGKGAVDEAG